MSRRTKSAEMCNMEWNARTVRFYSRETESRRRKWKELALSSGLFCLLVASNCCKIHKEMVMHTFIYRNNHLQFPFFFSFTEDELAGNPSTVAKR